jgi:hypothetical protein
MNDNIEDPELIEEPALMPDWERFYLYRVEMYLIHKYAPDLVDELKVSFARARARREGVLKTSAVIIGSKEELMMQIQADLQTHAPWKPKKTQHKRSSMPRPGISGPYQQEFENL